MSALGLRFTSGHALWVAALAPPCILLFLGTRYAPVGPALVALGVVLATVTFRGRRVTGWMAAVIAWLPRRSRPLHEPTDTAVGATVQPGERVAVRWQGRFLVAVVELIPRPFTTTVIVDGHAHTDDVVDTELLQELLAVHCPDLEADIVSAGYRIGTTATPRVANLYGTLIGSDPAPVHRRTWIVLRADPLRALKSGQRRDVGAAGLARYLVASATRIADRLASHGVDARCGRSFDEYDEATRISFDREGWSTITGPDGFTAAYMAPGGPDVWWSAPADRTIATVRIDASTAPQSTVTLTTVGEPRRPQGFSRVSGGQREALYGLSLVPSRHCKLPIGPAGVLVGQTASQHRVYMPFDDVDVSLTLGGAQVFMQFAMRSAAAGGIVTLPPRFQEFAEMIGAEVGPEAKVAWPAATTYFGERRGIDHEVVLRHDVISTPRHRKLAIQPVTTPDESVYEKTLPR
ncbi:MAG: type VII secretion protein EccE [Mycobacterium sp.]